MSIDWICKHHSDLGKEQLYAILQLRTEVFIVEQKHAYQELDGQDLAGDTCHLMAWQDDELKAYLRLLDPQSKGGDVVIDHAVTALSVRRMGLGHEMMDKALEVAEKNWRGMPIFLSAPLHLRSYYEKYGFSVTGEEYEVDDVIHIGMRRG